jgi:hypothetical protein
VHREEKEVLCATYLHATITNCAPFVPSSDYSATWGVSRPPIRASHDVRGRENEFNLDDHGFAFTNNATT